MPSTMQDEPLSLATLLRYAATFHGDSTVSTWAGTGLRTMTFSEMGSDAARLANALRALGIGEVTGPAPSCGTGHRGRVCSLGFAMNAWCSWTTAPAAHMPPRLSHVRTLPAYDQAAHPNVSNRSRIGHGSACVGTWGAVRIAP